MRVSWELLGGFILLATIHGCTAETRCFSESCSGGTGGAGSASASSGAGGASSTSSASGVSSASSSSSGTAGSGGGVAGACGGKMGLTCAADEFCDFPDDRCGIYDGLGTCKPRPAACPDIFIPTCGCDGMIHSNPCDADASGTDVSNVGNCAPPMGQFGCGAHFCQQGTQYCAQTYASSPDMPDTFACKMVPAGVCGAMPTCACLTGAVCPNGGMCMPSPDGGGLVISCN